MWVKGTEYEKSHATPDKTLGTTIVQRWQAEAGLGFCKCSARLLDSVNRHVTLIGMCFGMLFSLQALLVVSIIYLMTCAAEPEDEEECDSDGEPVGSRGNIEMSEWGR